MLVGIGLVILGVLSSIQTAHADTINTHIWNQINNHSMQPVIRALNRATPQDDVIIDIDSGGGDVSASWKVITAIHNTNAHAVISRITDFAASAAADIAMESDRIQIAPKAILMFHLGSIGKTTLTGDMVTSPPAETPEFAEYVRWMIGYMHHYDDKTLSSKDWKVIMKGNGIYVTGVMFFKRTGSYYITGIHHMDTQYEHPPLN